MNTPTRSEILFSVKSFAAAMLSVYLSMRIGLPRPFWAMMTAYICAAPFAGPTRSKGLYRAGGTVLGAIAVTFLVPRLINSPELLSLTLALWIAGCLYFSLLDRTPRSYMLMLGGYTAGLIAFPAVNDPSAIFDIALARVEEILLGITCATVVHSLVLPQPFGPMLLARLDNAVRDAHHWIRDALNPAGDARAASDRRKLAGDITEMRLMTTHLPFDTSHLRWTETAVNALQERLAAFVPIVSGVEDRLTALRDMGATDVSARWRVLLKDVVALTETPKDVALDAPGAALRQRIDALEPAVNEELGWTGMIEVNLAARLRRLIDVCIETRALRQHIDAGVHGSLPEAVRHLPGVPMSALHHDRGMAVLSAFAAAVAVLACCAFWILTGWPSGAAAPMMTAVLCCFFSTQDNPVPFIKTFMWYSIFSIPLSAVYLLGILPAVHGFESFILACAPTFLVLGVFVARPATYGRAIPFLFGICGTLAMVDTHNADMVSFMNSTLSQVVGYVAAAVTTSVFRTVGAGWTARRLLKAGWRELSRLGSGERVPSLPEFSARMVDRVGMLTPRLALAGKDQDLQAVDALRDLRIGLNMTLLQSVRAQLGRGEAAVGPLMKQLSRHFALRPAVDAGCERSLLDTLDNALRAICAGQRDAAQREALAALTGMRRDLFPKAAAYAPSLATAL
ncbi:FUSC family protein [Massilia sp. Root335]|uniref:FUSC family protein n=1 Tax=Massilia sp. Root335 TaxID=1736517 RepID=UPI000702106C|nr:FUSC family protein [Massilia sp. Root335]KQV51640.1 fusaric acid resistance protein [Massilia sp. Root335]